MKSKLKHVWKTKFIDRLEEHHKLKTGGYVVENETEKEKVMMKPAKTKDCHHRHAPLF